MSNVNATNEIRDTILNYVFDSMEWQHLSAVDKPIKQ